MAEQITEHVQRLEFETLTQGDNIVITTGKNEEAWQYDFDVTNGGRWPTRHTAKIWF